MEATNTVGTLSQIRSDREVYAIVKAQGLKGKERRAEVKRLQARITENNAAQFELWKELAKAGAGHITQNKAGKLGFVKARDVNKVTLTSEERALKLLESKGYKVSKEA